MGLLARRALVAAAPRFWNHDFELECFCGWFHFRWHKLLNCFRHQHRFSSVQKILYVSTFLYICLFLLQVTIMIRKEINKPWVKSKGNKAKERDGQLFDWLDFSYILASPVKFTYSYIIFWSKLIGIIHKCVRSCLCSLILTCISWYLNLYKIEHYFVLHDNFASYVVILRRMCVFTCLIFYMFKYPLVYIQNWRHKYQLKLSKRTYLCIM